MTSTLQRPPLVHTFVRRTRDFFRMEVRWYGGLRRLGAYGVGAVFTVYGVVDLFYDLNIDLFGAVDLPLYDFYRQEVVPFLRRPLAWVGLNAGPLYGTLVAVAGVGSAIWASAELSTNQYLVLYPFTRWQKRAGWVDTEADWTKAPERPVEPRWRWLLRQAARVPETVLLSYSLVGVLVLLVGAVSGAKQLADKVTEVIGLLGGLLLATCRYLLWPRDSGRGTRLFRLVDRADADVEEWLWRRLTGPNVVDPRAPMKELVAKILTHASRVASITIPILIGLIIWGLF